MRILLSAALAAAFASAASADTVWLKNGGKLEGVTTTIEGDKLVVKMPGGTVRLNSEDILKVVHRATSMEEYEIAAAKLKKDDAKGHFDLANWCAAQNLGHFERVELEATVAADPEHKEARERLGYENVGGKWLRGEDLMKAKGMVKVDGKWMTKEEAAAQAASKEKKRLERELAEAERKAKREAEMAEEDRLRDFYESQDRVRRRLDERGDDFDSRRGARAYPGRSIYGWDPGYEDGGSYFYAGTWGYYPYGYYYAPYSYYYYPYSYASPVGLSYTGRHFSFTFGTSHYGYPYPGYYSGGTYGPWYQGAGTNSFGPVSPSGSSSGSFDRGGAPHYGGAR